MVDENDKNELGSFGEDEYLAAEADYERDNAPPKQNLKEIWEQNPSLKIFAGVAGIAIFLIAFMVLGSDDAPSDKEKSAVRQTADVTQIPGTAELPPAYEEAVRQANEKSAEMAAVTGGSAIPTPIARPSERIEAPVQVEDSDPLSEWRKEAEMRRLERQKLEEDRLAQQQSLNLPELPKAPQGAQTGVAQPQNPPLPTGPSPEQVQQMAQGLQTQMQTILETQVPKESVVVSMNIQPPYKVEKYFPPEPPAGFVQANANSADMPANMNAKPKPIISAGTIAYAQILTEANSDVPGPVLAEVASGPLAGGRAIGSFQVAEEHLVVQFNRVVKDGVEYSVQAYALDPGTTLPGMASDINNHYFTRIFLPAAAEFVSGFAEAATQKDTNITVNNGTVTSETSDLDTGEELLKGVNEAGQKMSEIIDEDADRPRTIRLFAGTRIGILFLNSVVDPNTVQQQQQFYAPQQGGQGNFGQAVFNASPYGQAYNAYQAYQQGGNTGYVAATGAQPYPSTPSTSAIRQVR